MVIGPPVEQKLLEDSSRALNPEQFDPFPNVFPTDRFDIYQSFPTLNFKEKNIDLILASIPLEVRGKSCAGVEFPTSNLSWEVILELSLCLSENGIGAFLMGPLGFHGTQGEKFLSRMKKSGIHVNSYLDLPQKLLAPLTHINPILVFVSKHETPIHLESLTGIADVDNICLNLFSFNEVINNPKNKIRKKFRGFKFLEIERQISRLETRYKEFKSKKLETLVLNLVRGKENNSFQEIENAIYLKRTIGSDQLVTDLNEISGRIDNWVQIELHDTVSNEYLKSFFSSTLGSLIVKSCSGGSVIQRIDLNLLLSTEIPIPDLAIQKQIIEVKNRIDRLEVEISDLKNEVSLNPQNSSVIQKIDSMLRTSKALTKGDQIKTLILQGESKSLEFKQTFQYCIHRKNKEKDIETSSLKTIVGFLNAEGGVLLIGVEDNGLIPGLAVEIDKFHKTKDKYLLNLKNKIKDRIGLPYFRFLTIEFVEVDDVFVLQVVCKSSNEEVFLDNSDFYIRTSPSTEKLEGRDLSTYVRNRFYNP